MKTPATLLRARRHGWPILVATLAVLCGLASPAAAATTAGVATIPTAQPSAGNPGVGPLFPDGTKNPHTCTAAVVQSTGHNLVVTAAHCVTGTGAGLQFAPGYRNGEAPNGVWTVQNVSAPTPWVNDLDPANDDVFLQVAAQQFDGHIRNVQDVVGGGAVLGTAPSSGTKVTVIGYTYGNGGGPISCVNTVIIHIGYPEFDCHGYSDGTSGSPFLVARPGQHSLITGVIGGHHQGGCYEWQSFSSPFGSGALATLARAEQGGPGDDLDMAGDDGC